MTETDMLHDDSLMDWGTHKGKRLGDIPDDYWLWFLKQEWSSNHPRLVRYARVVEQIKKE